MEYGLSPLDLEQCSSEMLDAILQHIAERSKDHRPQRGNVAPLAEQRQALAAKRKRG